MVRWVFITDLKLGWTVEWRTVTGKKKLPDLGLISIYLSRPTYGGHWKSLKAQWIGKINNHTANKNKQSKYGKLYFIEHSSEYLSI